MDDTLPTSRMIHEDMITAGGLIPQYRALACAIPRSDIVLIQATM